MTLCLGLLLNLTEVMCYFNYFHYIFRHESTVAANIIKPSELKNRRNANAFSMAGQMAGWVMNIWQILYVGVSSLFFDSYHVNEFIPFFKMLEFPLLPLIQTYTSPPIKRFLKQK